MALVLDVDRDDVVCVLARNRHWAGQICVGRRSENSRGVDPFFWHFDGALWAP
jgi:hypothetical protein